MRAKLRAIAIAILLGVGLGVSTADRDWAGAVTLCTGLGAGWMIGRRGRHGQAAHPPRATPARDGTFLGRLRAAHARDGLSFTDGLTIEEAIDEVRGDITFSQRPGDK
jgi:hypothetical protein